MNSKTVKFISECFVKPEYISEEMKQPCYLTPWDLAMISAQYIQKGFLFKKPDLPSSEQEHLINNLIDKLKHSLSLALIHFYPLAGRLKTEKRENPHSYVVFVDCGNGPGAKLFHASLDMSISDILSPTYVPVVVQALFDHDRAVNHDGHFRPLLSVQVTDLVDGVFMGCSMNHCLGDGTSFWNFLKAWSEIFLAKEKGCSVSISRPPVIKRWFPTGRDPIISLPFNHQDEFISRFETPPLLERIFHFTSESIAKLKTKANLEHGKTSKISSLQSLSALLWRCITRARNLPVDRTTRCRLATNNRSRLDPPLPESYFGNSIHAVMAVATAGELLSNNLGWAALKLNEAVANHNDKVVREFLDAWWQAPFVYQIGRLFDPDSVMIGSSPRFDKYGCEFGLGKAVALRSGYAHKFDGKVSAYPGREGSGSVDFEVCLSPDFMHALESDAELMDGAS